MIGIIAGFLAMLLGGAGSAFGAEGAGGVVVQGLLAVFIGVVAIVGGALASRHPGVTAVLELASGIAGFIAVSLFWIISGPLLLVGALLAYLSHRASGAASGHEPA